MGLRATLDLWNGGVAPLVDSRIGNVFPDVQSVATYLDEVRYLVYNMEAIVAATGGVISTMGGEYANDAAAEAGGVEVGHLYHTAGTVKVRLA